MTWESPKLLELKLEKKEQENRVFRERCFLHITVSEYEEMWKKMGPSERWNINLRQASRPYFVRKFADMLAPFFKRGTFPDHSEWEIYIKKEELSMVREFLDNYSGTTPIKDDQFDSFIDWCEKNWGHYVA